MNTTYRRIGIFALALPLTLAACSPDEKLVCTGSGEEVLRCRAELSGNAEATELVELLLSGKASSSID